MTEESEIPLEADSQIEPQITFIKQTTQSLKNSSKKLQKKKTKTEDINTHDFNKLFETY